MISSAWAKLTRCITPKISEMPRASRAYVLPRPMPSTSVWSSSRHARPADEVTEQVLVRGQLRARAFDGDPPGAQHVAAVGDLQRPPGVLLDDEHRAAARAQLDEEVEHDVDHDRRQPERRLVEQDDLRVRHQRPSRRRAAGPRRRTGSRRPSTTGCRAPGSAARTSSSRAPALAGAGRDAGQLEVLADREVAEDAAVARAPGPARRARAVPARRR